MRKKLFAGSLIIAAALSFGACGEMKVSQIGDDTDTQCGFDDSSASDSDGYVYYQIDERERKSVLTDPSDYESGNSSNADEEMFAEIEGTLMNAFGCTYSTLDGCGYDSVYTMDAMPSVYGLENYSVHANEILLMKQMGSERLGADDVCIGAYGWLSRIFNFEHEWQASITDFTDALRETYPDCTSLQFIDKSAIPSAPSNISSTLGYVEFTAPFCLERAKVRLYIEAADSSDPANSIASSDTWVYLCRM